jgi:hypothetical protein
MLKLPRQLFLALPILLLISMAGFAQAPATQAAQAPDIQNVQPTDVDETFMQDMGVKVEFETTNKTSSTTRAAMQQNRIVSVPTFTSSFTFQNQAFPFTMVGRNPRRGDTTRVETQLIPISMFFEGFVDAQNNPIVLDVTPDIQAFRNSPEFRRAQFETGFTQFGDAVQRAEFFHVMEPDWHTLINEPHLLTPVTIDVPRGSANLFRSRSTGVIFAVVDSSFFISQLNTIIQLENLEVDALPIALTPNVFLAPGANIRRCCTLGFHTAFDAGTRGNAQLVQTFAWASWVDAGIFQPGFQDVVAVSHEITEWLNDPFGNNIVPAWQFPNGAGGCQNNLETGDPIEVFANSTFPVTVDGVTYHPQTEALLQWFARESPSNAIDGAFSFPNETLLTGPSQPCAP